MPTLTDDTAAVLARMLRRLPSSLWDTDPASNTLQRDLYRAFAAQVAVWLENRAIARTMTLLLEADGVDLDTLLADYGLKRYLQRPDAYARQIAMQILWTPKGTHYAVATMADLLFDAPHLTLRTGRSHTHVLLADTHPITRPHSYWGMLSDEGRWYALTIDGTVPTISVASPPGLDLSPGIRPLHWFVVEDELSATWYVTIAHDTLVVSQTLPAWGVGTSEAFSVLDGQGTTWELSVDSRTEALVATSTGTGVAEVSVLSPNHAFQALALVDSAAVTWWLAMDGGTGALHATLPIGATDVTPSGGPFRWLRLQDLAGTFWYASPTTLGTWFVDTAPPGGLGTALPQGVGDAFAVLWHWGVAGNTFAMSDAPHIDYGGMATAICLRDAAGQGWFWRVRGGRLEWSAHLWPDTIDQSPWGDLGWLEVITTTGAVAYVYPSLQGAPVSADGPPSTSFWGWREPVTLIDATGARWQIHVGLATFDAVDYWRLTDEDGTEHALWIEGEVPTTAVSPPDDGVDQFPGELPFDWLTVVDERARPWYVALRGETLVVSALSPPAAVSPVLQSVQDLHMILWSLQYRRQPEALVTVETGPWRVGVSPVATVTIPLPTTAIALRDAMEAVHHVQAAGSLVTVLIT